MVLCQWMWKPRVCPLGFHMHCLTQWGNGTLVCPSSSARTTCFRRWTLTHFYVRVIAAFVDRTIMPTFKHSVWSIEVATKLLYAIYRWRHQHFFDNGLQSSLHTLHSIIYRGEYDVIMNILVRILNPISVRQYYTNFYKMYPDRNCYISAPCGVFSDCEYLV